MQNQNAGSSTTTPLSCSGGQRSAATLIEPTTRGSIPPNAPTAPDASPSRTTSVVVCEKRRNDPGEWICDRCGSLWFGQLAETDWLPLSCPARG